MKKLLLLAIVVLWWLTAHGYSVDGTSSIKYLTKNQVFHGAEYVTGFVRLNDGLTVLPNASVLMDTFFTVSGGIDLRETGTLILNSDLCLAGNITLTEGGNIKGKAGVTGKGHTIFLGGDLTLASATNNCCLHITGDWTNSGTSGDTIIDGQGHTLWIGDRAQIFVDTNITLTLKNMTIKTSPKSVNSVPAIQLAAYGSGLALDNVIMDLGSDFNFKQGQLFIHDSVVVTGTSAFVYQSQRPSYIMSGATWMFDQGTTFSFAPAAYTDALYTQDYRSTATPHNFLVMADPISVLALNGCTLKTTYTGLRLRTGTVRMDNHVQINTQAGVDLATTTTSPITFVGGAVTGTNPDFVAWSPDDRFLAVANYTSSTLQVFRFTGSGVPVLLGSIATGANTRVAPWSPDGRFIAAVNETGNTLQVFRFAGTGAPVLIGTAELGTSAGPRWVSWSPDGRFLAVANNGNNTLRMYRFTGTGAPILLGIVSNGTGNRVIFWSPDGRFLSVVNGGNTLQIFRFKGSGVPVLLGTVSADVNPRLAPWSPDGRFLVVMNRYLYTLRVYRFTGTGVPVLLGSVATGIQPWFATWSPDGRFLALANAGDAANGLQMYRFNGSGMPISLGTVPTDLGAQSVSWSSDGRFIAVVHYDDSTLQVFRTNYVSVAESQAMSSSLIFGDSANGSAYNVTIKVNAGAQVVVDGKINDDSV